MMPLAAIIGQRPRAWAAASCVPLEYHQLTAGFRVPSPPRHSYPDSDLIVYGNGNHRRVFNKRRHLHVATRDPAHRRTTYTLSDDGKKMKRAPYFPLRFPTSSETSCLSAIALATVDSQFSATVRSLPLGSLLACSQFWIVPRVTFRIPANLTWVMPGIALRASLIRSPMGFPVGITDLLTSILTCRPVNVKNKMSNFVLAVPSFALYNPTVFRVTTFRVFLWAETDSLEKECDTWAGKCGSLS